ncbi:fimbrial protein [Caballeronia sp. HLA56]
MVAFGNVDVPVNSPVGAKIATKTASYDSLAGHQGIDCGGVSTTSTWNMSGAGASGVYPTNIPGIGIRVYMWASSSYYTTPTSPTLLALSYSYSYNACAGCNYGTGYLQVQVDLVVTGPISNFGVNALSYNVAPWVVFSGGGSSINAANLTVSASLNIPACSVTTSSIGVTLPMISFGNAASGAARGATSIDLKLNCAPGAKVAITLTDASNTANRSNVLSLQTGSTASGVGVQILYGGTVVSYGSDTSSWGNNNQFFIGTSTGGSMDVPLSVQYVRTAGALVPGTVKALATFTMSYQ